MKSIRLLVVVCVMLSGPVVSAFGPGVHMRESERTLQHLAEESDEWAELVEAPLAVPYLRLGSISPDFHMLSDELGFGHAKGLSYYLIDGSEELEPRFRLFALGHLAHTGSDASAEVFFASTLFASAPLGMFDLFEGENRPVGRTEDIVEAYGDLILGDYDAVVDTLFDFYLEDEAAEARMNEIISWYCEMGSEYHSLETDCALVLEQMKNRLSAADPIVGGAGREQARELVDVLIGGTPEELVSLFTGGLLSSLLGQSFAPSDHFELEVERFKNSVLLDLEFWELYDTDFVDLGPSLAIEQLEHRTEGWPRYYSNALISGNIQSVLQSDPDLFDLQPGLHVDELTFHNSSGEALTIATEAVAGDSLEAHVRLFVGLAFDGTVRGVVRGDRPGLSTSDDPVLGEASVTFSATPHDYATEPRTDLVIPFTADTEDVLGFYVELHVGDEPRPWFTTNWDSVWQTGELDLDWDVYQENFGTYGHWPSSLPVEGASSDLGSVFAKAVIFPNGGGIEGLKVSLSGVETSVNTAPNGVSVFDGLEPGAVYVRTAANEDYAASGPVSTAVAAGQATWPVLAVEAVPRLLDFDPFLNVNDCLEIRWNLSAFGDQADDFVAELRMPGGEPLLGEASVGKAGHTSLCPERGFEDGLEFTVALLAIYPGDLRGLESESEVVLVDASGPEITEPDVDLADLELGCYYERPNSYRMELSTTIFDPHSEVVSVVLDIGEERWRADLPEGGLDTSEGHPITFSIEAGQVRSGQALTLSASNAAGMETVLDNLNLPSWDNPSPCPDNDPDPIEPGCAVAASSLSGVWPGLVFGLLLVALRRSRRLTS